MMEIKDMSDIEYPERLTRPIERRQWSTEWGRVQLTLNQEVQKRVFAEGVAKERAEQIAGLDAEVSELEALVERLRDQLNASCVCEVVEMILGGGDE